MSYLVSIDNSFSYIRKGRVHVKAKLIFLAGLVAAVVGASVHAADLKVKGTIAPASCSFTITNSIIDYGSINPNSLSAINYTKLAAKSTPYVIKCGSHVKTKLGIKAVDNRASSRVPGMINAVFGGNYVDTYSYGLGTTAKGQKVGGYVVHLRNSVADGKAVSVLTSVSNGASWQAGGQALGHTANVAAWHVEDVTPMALNTLSGTLEVQAVINKTSELDLNSQISLDGQATLELRYL